MPDLLTMQDLEVHKNFVMEKGTLSERMKKPRAPRIGFEITEDQRKALKRFAPHGNVTALYQAITEDLIELFEKHGSAKVLAALISRQVKIYEISKTLFEASKTEA